MRDIPWLRLAYWAGIVTDAVAAIQMLAPRLMLRTFGAGVEPTPAFTYAMRYGAPLMIGWTLLLLWADRDPVARKDVLLLTVPVVIGYVVMAFYAVAIGLAPLIRVVPVLVIQALLLVLFFLGYRQGRRVEAA